MNIHRWQTGQHCQYSNLPETGWSRVQNLVNARFSVPICKPHGQTCFLYNEHCISFLEVKWPGLSVKTILLLVLNLVCGWSYTSTSPSIFKPCIYR